MLFVIVLVAFVLVIVPIVLVRRAGGVRFPYFQFYSKGHECGFSFAETNVLRRAVVAYQVENPLSVFWSVRSLDRCMRNTVEGVIRTGGLEDPRTVGFMTKLFDLRHRVELDQPKYKLGLTSTRSLQVGQMVRIATTSGTLYGGRLVANSRKNLTILLAAEATATASALMVGQRVRVNFWRKDDAGYMFDAKVLTDREEGRRVQIDLEHSDALQRAQKRRSVRRAVNLEAHLYSLRSIEAANERVESTAGFLCRLLDISEDGAAVLVGGRAKAGLPLKVQVTVGGQALILCGTVRGVSYKEKNNASILHIEGIAPSTVMRLRILSLVYGFSGPAANATVPTSVIPEQDAAQSASSDGVEPTQAPAGSVSD